MKWLTLWLPLCVLSQSPPLAGQTFQGMKASGRFSGEAGAKAGVKDGRLIKEGTGTSWITTQGKFEIQNPSKLEDIAEPFPMYFKVTEVKAPRDKQTPGVVKIDEKSISSVGRWRDAVNNGVDIVENKDLKELNTKIESLNTVARSNLREQAGNQDVYGVLKSYNEVRDTINRVYPTIRDDRARGALAGLRGRLETEQRIFFNNKLTSSDAHLGVQSFLATTDVEEKRFYLRNDNYRPEIYPMIAESSRSCVAIARKQDEGIEGSGVLIGPDIVLTCRHVIKPNTAKSFNESEYVVMFDYEERKFSPAIPRVIYACEEVFRGTGKNDDFLLLRIKRNLAALDPRVPLKLDIGRVNRSTPLFLVGHPQGLFRTIHDSSWVLFPHRLNSNEERGDIESAVAKELIQDETDGDYEQREKEAARKAALFMQTSYGSLDRNDKSTYVYRPAVTNGNLEECVGVESDTFKGDSGAPAIHRETGRVIGILRAGGSDAGASASTTERQPLVSARPGAKYHERVMPMSFIVSRLNDATSGLPSKGIASIQALGIEIQ